MTVAIRFGAPTFVMQHFEKLMTVISCLANVLVRMTSLVCFFCF